MAVAARWASFRVRQTTAPFPAASPLALITKGSSCRSIQASARSSSVKLLLAAVGTPALAITSLAKALEASIRAPAAEGPKASRPAARIRSANPSASGASGPITTRSMSYC